MLCHANTFLPIGPSITKFPAFVSSRWVAQRETLHIRQHFELLADDLHDTFRPVDLRIVSNTQNGQQ